MSALKLKKDIKLLEQQLNELEANISDPIERIEQKTLLEKKIKKLKHSKIQIEQLEQAQQELEFLKYEFSSNSSVNSNESVDENKVKEDNRNSQISNTNSRKEDSDTIISTLIASPSNNSKESRKAWIIGGTVGFFIFLGLILSGNRANQTASNTEQQASNTISSETIKQDNILKTEDIIDSSPKASTQLQRQNFNNYDFPLYSCGDKDPGGANIWYRVYVNDTPENLSIIRSNYCQDSIRKYRHQEQIHSIQVASFINKSKAEAFAQLMQVNIGSGEVSESSIYNSLSTESVTTTSPREFIINHYSDLNNRNYNSTWKNLTPEFKAKSEGFYGYTDWWNSVENIKIGEIEVLEQNNSRAVLNVPLTYLMKTGTTYKDPKSKIKLIWDNSANSWLFENKQ